MGSIPAARSMARWRNGDAMDGAPPINPGSIPGWASNLPPQLAASAVHRTARASRCTAAGTRAVRK
jgi:hypothetical protein